MRGLPGKRSILTGATNCLAGPCAEAAYSREPLGLVLVTSGHTDLARAEAILALYHEPGRLELYEAIERYGRIPTVADVIRRAERLVDDHWAAVRLLAVALLKNGQIDRATVKMLLDPLRQDRR